MTIKRAEDLAAGDLLGNGREVAAPPVVENTWVTVRTNWQGAPESEHRFRVGHQLVANIPTS